MNHDACTFNQHNEEKQSLSPITTCAHRAQSFVGGRVGDRLYLSLSCKTGNARAAQSTGRGYRSEQIVHRSAQAGAMATAP